MNTSYKHGL